MKRAITKSKYIVLLDRFEKALNERKTGLEIADKQYVEDKGKYLPQVAQERYNTLVKRVEEDYRTSEAFRVIKELEILDRDSKKSRYRASELSSYRNNIAHLMNVAGEVNPYIISIMKENCDKMGLECLLSKYDNSKKQSDVKLFRLIEQSIREIDVEDRVVADSLSRLEQIANYSGDQLAMLEGFKKIVVDELLLNDDLFRSEAPQQVINDLETQWAEKQQTYINSIQEKLQQLEQLKEADDTKETESETETDEDIKEVLENLRKEGF